MELIISVLILASIISLIIGLGWNMPVVQEWLNSRKAKDKDAMPKRDKDKGYKANKKQLIFLYIISPFITVTIAVMLFNQNLAAIMLGCIIGLVLPALWVRGFRSRMMKKFETQLPDSLMILVSCLRGGLSLIQAIEVLTEEMPWPTNQEFAQILKENKMGISLEESLRRLDSRIKSDDLVLFSSAIMVSRETGGDLTELFSRLNDSIRARNKVLENVKTLTLQGRIQSIVLSVLPIVFTYAIYKVNPTYFELMMSSEAGRMMLVIAGCLLAVGIFLVRVFSKVEV